MQVSNLSFFSYLRDSEGFLWGSKKGDNNEDNYWGVVTKNYFIEETASTPNPIKNSTSHNTYTIFNTYHLQNKFLQNGGYNSGSPEGAYGIGSTISQVVVQDPPKTIYNSSIKNPNDPDWFPGNYAVTSKTFSHCNESLLIQLDQGQSDADFNIVANGGANFILQDQLHAKRYGSSHDSTADGMNGYIANYKRTVNNQFGGNTYSARSFSEYVSTNCTIDISDRTSSITTKV